MINFTKQELEVFNPMVYTKFYQEYLVLLQDSITRYRVMFSLMQKGK